MLFGSGARESAKLGPTPALDLHLEDILLRTFDVARASVAQARERYERLRYLEYSVIFGVLATLAANLYQLAGYGPSSLTALVGTLAFGYLGSITLRESAQIDEQFDSNLYQAEIVRELYIRHFGARFPELQKVLFYRGVVEPDKPKRFKDLRSALGTSFLYGEAAFFAAQALAHDTQTALLWALTVFALQLFCYWRRMRRNYKDSLELWEDEKAALAAMDDLAKGILSERQLVASNGAPG